MGLVVYGARCAWWDSIEKCSTLPNGIPCCPFCKSVLFQEEEERWDKNVKAHEANGHPGYAAFIAWNRGKCFPSAKVAEAAYESDRRGRNDS